MKLRGYQDNFVNKSLDALRVHSGVLGVAATGAGKTVCLSAIAKEYGRVLILQHRTELMDQNSETFLSMNPNAGIAFISQGQSASGERFVFGMMQTVERRLEQIGPFDLIVIDEAHHAVCDSYLKIIEHVRSLNPECKVFGVTATPERADKKNLSRVFDVVSDRVQIETLIRMGYLVQPRAYVIKVADSNDLNNADSDEKVEAILNVATTHERMIKEWRDKAANRQTIVFCQTRTHGEAVKAAFIDAGVKADFVDGSMPEKKRKAKLKAFDKCKTQVMVNVNVLTEGFDSQPVSCVILLRSNSSKSSLIQMIGRGLRKLDPTRYPKQYKADCVVLDFGTSLIRHGDLDAGDRLFIRDEYDAEEDHIIQCDQCGNGCEPSAFECPVCGYILKDQSSTSKSNPDETKKQTEFRMTEFELMQESAFHYEKLPDGGRIASGWLAWALVTNYQGVWYAIAARHKHHAKIIAFSRNKIECLSTCDDFISLHGDYAMSGKDKSWIREPATLAQMNKLPEKMQGIRFTKHQAACAMVLHASSGRLERIKTKIANHYDEVGNKC